MATIKHRAPRPMAQILPHGQSSKTSAASHPQSPPAPAGHALRRAKDLASPELAKPPPEPPGPGQLKRAAALEGPPPPRVRPPDKASAALLGTLAPQPLHVGQGHADVGTVGDFRLDKLEDRPAADKKDNLLGTKVENKREHAYKKLEFKSVNGTASNNLATVGQSKMKGAYFKDREKGHFEAQGKAELGATAATVKYENTHMGRLGTTRTKASVEVGATLTGEGALKASRKEPGVGLHAKGEALVGVKAEAKVEHAFNKHASVGAEGSVTAGTYASGTATAVFDKDSRTAMVKVAGIGLAGAQEVGHGEVKMGPVRMSGGAGAIQGLYGGASFAGGMNNGRLGFTADVGASLGVGLRARVGANVNMNPLFDAAHGFGDKMKRGPRPPSHPSLATA
ncbi:hypothetical protein F0U62_15115 [Cystobacter fuscus]|uniref:hypothetical protein n=1 Tax=Cystobacter fuscus TaxID=43 RepID=UPI002B2D0D4F|nr:hypothetical protein F0U62_15115 [Cystobacter fuscus]